jgi:hypothetical protein
MTMTDIEIRRLYALIVAYDNRKVSEANITAWTHQAIENRWTYNEASEAVHQHHRDSTEFLMPAHITANIRAARRVPPAAADVLALAPADPAGQERVREIVAEVSSKLGWVPDGKAPSRNLTRPCPHCKAGPGRPCSYLVTRGPKQGQYVPLSGGRVHASREES